MARARNIKPSFFKNEQLVELPYATRLLFVGLWTLADREGRLEDRPKRIKMEIFPGDDVGIDRALNELHDANFIHRYEVNGGRYIEVCAFKKHQNPHYKEVPSTIPEPGVYSLNDRQSNLGFGGQSSTHKPGGNPGATRGETEASPGSARLIPDSLQSDSLQKHVRVEKGKKPPRTLLPADFVVSDRVKAWALAKGYTRLDEYLEAFKLQCAAKGYDYVDHDAGFMKCIREDWPKLRANGAHGLGSTLPPPDGKILCRGPCGRRVSSHSNYWCADCAKLPPTAPAVVR